MATAAILGGETGSIPRAEVIISFVDDSHGTFVPYGHVSFVKEVYPDDSFLVSETNEDDLVPWILLMRRNRESLIEIF